MNLWIITCNILVLDYYLHINYTYLSFILALFQVRLRPIEICDQWIVRDKHMSALKQCYISIALAY